VVEHESQYVCSACLAQSPVVSESAGAKAAGLSLAVFFVAAFFCAWFFFYVAGQSLLRVKE
jgi:hypothetical protein